MGLGSSVLIIAVVQALGAVVLVFITMRYIFNQPFSFSLLIGAISAATAPAAVLMVIRNTGKGPPNKDTSVGCCLGRRNMRDGFWYCLVLVTAINGGEGLTVGTVSKPIVEIFGSVLLGFWQRL